jgi:Cys-rich protein (TIGR01571 family)
MFRVVAPRALQEGTTLGVAVEGKQYRVMVPPGGVEKDDEFEFSVAEAVEFTIEDESNYMIDEKGTPHAEEEEETTENHNTNNLHVKPTLSSSDEEDESEYDSIGAPKGRWRTHLCACCDVMTQATFWMSCCCSPVLIAQLVTRLGLSWKGTKASPEEASLAFNRIVLSFIGVLLFGNFPAIGFVAAMTFTICLMLWTGQNLRRAMRRRYNIPPTLHENIDDCCCMFWCCCCSNIQMARHTHDDKEYPGACCTTTGLELDAPHIV